MRRALSLIALLVCSWPAHADRAYRPGLESLTFEADSVVLAQVKTRGRVVVLQVMHGDPSLAERTLRLPGLGGLDMTEGWAMPEEQQTAITPDRALLFLQGDGPELRVAATGFQGSAGTYWVTPEDRVYGYTQMMDGLTLVAGGEAHSEVPADWGVLRDRVQVALEQRRQWEAVLAQPPKERAALMATYTAAHTKPAHYRMDTVPQRTLRPALAKLGAHAVPALIRVIETAAPGADLNLPVLSLYDIGPAAASAIAPLRALKDNPGRTHVGYIDSAIESISGGAATGG